MIHRAEQKAVVMNLFLRSSGWWYLVLVSCVWLFLSVSRLLAVVISAVILVTIIGVKDCRLGALVKVYESQGSSICVKYRFFQHKHRMSFEKRGKWVSVGDHYCYAINSRGEIVDCINDKMFIR